MWQAVSLPGMRLAEFFPAISAHARDCSVCQCEIACTPNTVEVLEKRQQRKKKQSQRYVDANMTVENMCEDINAMKP